MLLKPVEKNFDEIGDVLQNTLEKLHKQATANKLAFNASKTAGLSTAVLSVLGCFGAPALGIPVAMVGGAIYIAGLLSETVTTDKVRLLPFCNIDLTGLAKLVTQSGSADAADIEFASYLPIRDRILYLFILTQGNRMVEFLSKIPMDKWEPSIEALLNQTRKGARLVGDDINYETFIKRGDEILSTEAHELGVPIALPVPKWQSISDLPIGNNTRLNSIEVSSFQIPVESPESKLFDWNRLNTAYDDFPHLMLLGKTGAGKSFLAERLGRFLEGDTIVITPKKKPKDFEGMQVIGIPYDYRTIAANLSGLSTLVKQREAEMNATGNENFHPVNVILDEVPTFVAGCKELDFDVVKDLKFIIRAGRTSKIRLILLAQGQEVKTLGIEGEGSLRDNLNYVYLKGFAEKHAQEIKLDISQYDRPCIIDGQVAEISKLIELANQKPQTQAVRNEKSLSISEKEPDEPLEDHEVNEEPTETSSSISEILVAFPNWKGKTKTLEVASLVLDFLRRKPDKSFSPSRIKSDIRKLKDDQTMPNERLKNLLTRLSEKGLLTESNGQYSAVQISDDDYDF